LIYEDITEIVTLPTIV